MAEHAGIYCGILAQRDQVNVYDYNRDTEDIMFTRSISASDGVSDIALDSVGALYVANAPSAVGAGSVAVYAHDGAPPTLTLSGSEIVAPSCLAIDRDDNLYVLNSVFNSSYCTVYARGAQSPSRPALVFSVRATSIAIGAIGKRDFLYVFAEDSSVCVCPTGTSGEVVLNPIIQPIGVSPYNLGRMAFDSHNNLYVTNAEGGINVYNEGGAQSGTIPTDTGGIGSRIVDLAIDPERNWLYAVRNTINGDASVTVHDLVLNSDGSYSHSSSVAVGPVVDTAPLQATGGIAVTRQLQFDVPASGVGLAGIVAGLVTQAGVGGRGTWAGLPLGQRETLLSFAISNLADLMRDGEARTEIQGIAAKAAWRALKPHGRDR